MNASAQPGPAEPTVPPAVLGRTTASVQTSAGLLVVGEIAEQSAGWLRVKGVATGAPGTRDWWLPIATITAIEVRGDA